MNIPESLTGQGFGSRSFEYSTENAINPDLLYVLDLALQPEYHQDRLPFDQVLRNSVLPALVVVF